MEYQNRTALITGASSGIGLGYARELAKRGSNLVLVARREERLNEAAAELRQQHAVRVDVIAMDLAVQGAAGQLAQRVAALGVEPDLLFNNAGFGTSGRFANEDLAKVQQELQLNIATLVELTGIYLPKLKARNFGAIVNIASTASFQPVPGLAVYAATKAFVRSFTSALWGELQGTNVRALTVNPGATATEFFEVAGTDPFGKLAPIAEVVSATFKALDAAKSRPSVVVGKRNAFLAWTSTVLPSALVIKVSGSMFLPKE